MKEINFSDFRVKYSAILDQVRKTRRSIRLIRFGKPLAEIVPLSPAKNEAGAKKLRKSLQRKSKA